jgi:hypothetical protein
VLHQFDPHKTRYVIGLDLDGVCADFYSKMREIAAEWLEVDIGTLTTEVEYGLREWGIDPNEDYDRLHRFAVTQRNLFLEMDPIPGAARAIRNLGLEGARIRIITHRLFIRHFHEIAVQQTTQWLDRNGFRYWDLCFMRDKEAVFANIYVDDTPSKVSELIANNSEEKFKVLVFTDSTNAKLDFQGATRVDDWGQAEEVIRSDYHAWLTAHHLSPSPGIGREPDWAKDENAGKFVRSIS